MKEAAVNIAVGFTFTNLTILPLLWSGRNPFLGGLYIGIAFTIISCVRQYVIRRWFNKGDHA